MATQRINPSPLLKRIYRYKECKIIPIHEYKSVNDENDIDARARFKSERDFFENFNYIPISIFIKAVFPIIYILVLLDAIKSKLGKNRELIFTLDLKHRKVRKGGSSHQFA